MCVCVSTSCTCMQGYLICNRTEIDRLLVCTFMFCESEAIYPPQRDNRVAIKMCGVMKGFLW